MKNQYFTLSGQHFQTGGSGIENAINVKCALDQIGLLFEQGYSDWSEALDFLDERYGHSMMPLTRDFRNAVERGDDTTARFHAMRIYRRAQGRTV